MNFATWNVRSFNNHAHITEACSFISRHHLSLIGKLETMMCLSNESRSQRSFFFTWRYVVIYGGNGVGRMKVCWDSSRVVVDFIDTATQWIHVKATFLHSSTSCFVIFVYGLNEVSQRRVLWDFVRAASRKYRICLGVLFECGTKT